MTQTEIEVALKDHENQIKSLKHRMDNAEENDKAINSMALSIQKLAINMENMAKEQQKQGDRLEKLEREPADDHKYYKRLIIGCVVTGVISMLVGAAMTVLLNGGVS